MSYCPKCGTKVTEEMAFCPKCGAALKVEQAPTEAKPSPKPPQRVEKGEKREKEEKEEKGEKGEKAERREKRELGFIGPLVGGFILIFLGLMFYLQVTGALAREVAWASFLIIIGIIIIAAAIYGAIATRRRYPKV